MLANRSFLHTGLIGLACATAAAGTMAIVTLASAHDSQGWVALTSLLLLAMSGWLAHLQRHVALRHRLFGFVMLLALIAYACGTVAILMIS